jgi:hypothetical protein
VLDRVGVCALVSASVGEGEEMLDGLLVVITHNVRHFSRIRGLEIEDWLDGDLRRA